MLKNHVLPKTTYPESTPFKRKLINGLYKFFRFCIYYGKYVSHSYDE